MVRHMSRPRFNTFMLRVCHLRNCKREREMDVAGRLLRSGTKADLSGPPPPRNVFPTRDTCSPLFIDVTAVRDQLLRRLRLFSQPIRPAEGPG